MSKKTPELRPLRSFLSAVRARLWAGRALLYCQRMLWHIGLISLALAAVDLLVITVPTSVLLLGVFVPGALAVTRILASRPSLGASAAKADRTFGGQALMTTAAECLDIPQPELDAASNVVLHQASDAAQRWSPNVSRTLVLPQSARTALAIMPVFAAIVLLSIPKAELDYDGGPTKSETSLGIADGVDGRTPSDRDNLASLRSALGGTEPAPDNPAPPSKGLIEPKFAASPRGIVAKADTEPDLLPPQMNPAAGRAGQSADNGVLPGDAAASNALRGEDDAAPFRFQSREAIEIQHNDRSGTSGAGQNASYSELQSAPEMSNMKALPAAAPHTHSQWTILAPAQAAYARRYLERTGVSYE